jgi:hypothetical protein
MINKHNKLEKLFKLLFDKYIGSFSETTLLNGSTCSLTYNIKSLIDDDMKTYLDELIRKNGIKYVCRQYPINGWDSELNIALDTSNVYLNIII